MRFRIVSKGSCLEGRRTKVFVGIKENIVNKKDSPQLILSAQLEVSLSDFVLGEDAPEVPELPDPFSGVPVSCLAM